MEWITNEILLYGGLCMAVVAAIALVICFVTYKFKKVKLFNQLNKEYGDPPEGIKKSKSVRRGDK